MNFRNPKHLLLLLLPVVYLILIRVFFVNWTPAYIACPDPIYIYLFNGMTIASGHLKIFYVDNPGIPVQCFSAIVIYVKHLFNTGIPLYQDVLLHPEQYIYVLCVSASILHCLVIMAMGYYVFTKTKNIALALLFQITPLIGNEMLSISAPSPESFYIVSGMFFVAYLYCNSIYKNPQFRNEIKLQHIIAYGIFTGFMISCKYICFPLLFLVLFLLPTSRSRIQYISSLILFFLIFISPALPAWKNILQWLFNLATHTGQYGQGDHGFVNSSEFLNNLRKIFQEDTYFTGIYILMNISLFIAFIRRKQTLGGKAYLRLLYGLWTSSAVLIILVAKHYSFHYLIPIRLCFPLIIIASYGVFREQFTLKIIQNKLALVILSYSFFTFLAYVHLKAFFTYPPQPASHETADFLNKYKNTPIIFNADLGSSRIETALYLGNAYTGNYSNQHAVFLKRNYPNSYIYKQNEGAIMHWDDISYTPELFLNHPKIIVYFIDKDSTTINSILTNISIFGKDTIARFNLVYNDKESDEYIYELEGNQNIARRLMANPTEINFNFEDYTFDKSKFISTDKKDTIDDAKSVSNKERHSGDNSILMNIKNQYALTYEIRAFPGNIINVNIWRKSDDGRGCIVFTSKKYGDFYSSGQAVIDSDAKGWKQIEYKCIVPSSIKDSNVMFYLYYYGNGYAYFDDLSIKIYPMTR